MYKHLPAPSSILFSELWRSPHNFTSSIRLLHILDGVMESSVTTPSSQKLKNALEAFRYQTPTTDGTPPLRQSARRQQEEVTVKSEPDHTADDVLPSLPDLEGMRLKRETSLQLPLDDPPTMTLRKRARVKLEDGLTVTPSPKKVKRGFAPPEQYAHLDNLDDHLKEDLDGACICPSCQRITTADPCFVVVMFCGVKSVFISFFQYHIVSLHFSSPGCKSAEVGHHFANPTNHFWKCLHQSRTYTCQLHCMLI